MCMAGGRAAARPAPGSPCTAGWRQLWQRHLARPAALCAPGPPAVVDERGAGHAGLKVGPHPLPQAALGSGRRSEQTGKGAGQRLRRCGMDGLRRRHARRHAGPAGPSHPILLSAHCASTCAATAAAPMRRTSAGARPPPRRSAGRAAAGGSRRDAAPSSSPVAQKGRGKHARAAQYGRGAAVAGDARQAIVMGASCRAAAAARSCSRCSRHTHAPLRMQLIHRMHCAQIGIS